MATQPSDCRTTQTAGEHSVRPESPRRYTPRGMGAEEFFTELLRRSCRYVALRWFEGLPSLEPGEDIDLLIADDDLIALDEILDPTEGAIPCDVYTVSGLPATDYRNIAYYPPYLAEQILDRRMLHQELVSIPSTIDYFFSLTITRCITKDSMPESRHRFKICPRRIVPSTTMREKLHRSPINAAWTALR